MRKSRLRALCVKILAGTLATMTVANAADSDRAPLLPSAKARSTVVDTARAAGVPEDAVLEANNARIGAIQFKALELFDIGGRDQDSTLFRWGNRFHYRTREATIADQLLFKEGDVYNASAVAES